jgi:hypothetical protein
MSVGLAGGFYYAQNWLNDMAVSINKERIELSKDDNIEAQTTLQNELNNLKSVELKAVGLISPSSDYQISVSADLSKYASNTGIQIDGVSPSQLPVGATVSNILGVQAKYVTVTIKNPVPFNNLVKFLKAIETNIPKMRLTGITIVHNSSMGNSVAVDPLTLEVYTK